VSDEQQSALELQALQRVIASGARALEIEVVLDRYLEQALRVARADAGAPYMRDPKRNLYRLGASRNSPSEFTPTQMQMDEEREGDHRLYDLADLEKIEPLSIKARAAGFTHGLVLLLLVDQRRVGFIGLLFKAKPALAESTMRTLEAICAFEAVALESARVHQQAELRASVAQTLNECAEQLLELDGDLPHIILEAACKVARGHGALLSEMFDRDGTQYARVIHALGDDVPLIGMELPTTTPYLRESLAQRAPTVVEDTATLDPATVFGRIAKQQGSRSFILATMWQRDRPLGQLFVKANEPRVYADAEIEALQLLSSMAAQALARARHQAAERVEHERVAAILEHLPASVAVIGKSGAIIHENAAARAFGKRMGSDDPDWRAAMAQLTILDRDGKPLPPSERPLVRAFSGETSARELTLESKQGRRVHVQAIAVPLRNADGTQYAVMTAFHDVTELRELADAKDRFLSIASHELRSPITSLRATTSLLQLDPNALTDESRRNVLLSRIQRQIDRLSTLVERLLDTTRLNAGELPLDYAEGDLAALCHDAAEHARLTDPEHPYVVDAPPSIPGRWDVARIEQVLTNLLSNACRYSPPRSEILIRARVVDGERATIDVVDRGPGIAPDQLERLFTAFYRGSAAARHKGGLGLGLYITREIVRRHGGVVRVASTPGQGATFTVELPLRPQ
jgi:signal transduction histidine kinase